MPPNKLLARTRDVLTSLLLAVAVSLAWPAMATPHEISAHSLAHATGAADAHAHDTHDATPACPSDRGCCVMTHCHPGVAQPLLPVPAVAPLPRSLPPAATDEAGIVPAILVPPPRLVLG